MFSEIVITIPIYVYRKSNDLYDHPTQLDSFEKNETCSRLLQSVIDTKQQGTNITIVLLYGKTNAGDLSNEEIEDVFKKTYVKFVKDDIKILLAGDKFLQSIIDILKEKSINFPVSNIQYGNIRNLQLLTQLVLGNDIQVNVDDDEIISRERFFEEIEVIGNYMKNNPEVGGVGGLYVNDRGNPDILSSDAKRVTSNNMYAQKEALMQQMIDGFMSNQWTTPAPTVFGGLTCMSQQLVQLVCYDPSIQRGEDIDFLIHGLYKHLYFSMDRAWTIIHKPPGASLGTSHIPTKEKRIRDVKRFLYEKEKIVFLSKRMNITVEEIISHLQPYPGAYFTVDTQKLIDDAQDICNPEELEKYLENDIPERLEKFWQYWNIWPEVCRIAIQKRQALMQSFIEVI